MNKVILALLSLILVFSFVFIPAGTSQAVTWSDPVVTRVSGDNDFSVKVVDPITLAIGTAKTESGLVVPAGFPLGSMQFGGNAVTIKGFENGKVNVCFSFPSYRYGWKGSIYQWTDAKWTAVPSNTAEGVEGAPATVCTTISSDGTYALLAGYTLKDKPIPPLPVCNAYDVFWIKRFDRDISAYSLLGMYISPALPEGTQIRYSIVEISPAGSLTGALSGSGKVHSVNSELDQALVYFLRGADFPTTSYYESSTYPTYTMVYLDSENRISSRAIVRIYTPTCYQDVPLNLPFGDD